MMLEDAVTALLTCPLCLEIFNEDDRKPKMLPCQHCFCQKCLQTLLKQSTYRYTSCPTCRKLFPSSRADARDLDTDFKMMSLIGPANSEKKSAKEREEKKRKDEDEKRRQAEEKKKEKEKNVISRKHCIGHNMPYVTICVDCHLGLCSQCVHDRNHSIMDAPDYYRREQQRMEQQKQQLHSNIAEMRSRIEKFSEEKDPIVEQSFAGEYSIIDDNLQRIRDYLNRWEEKAKDKVQRAKIQQSEELTKRMNYLQSYLSLKEAEVLNISKNVEQLTQCENQLQSLSQKIENMFESGILVPLTRCSLGIPEEADNENQDDRSDNTSDTQELPEGS